MLNHNKHANQRFHSGTQLTASCAQFRGKIPVNRGREQHFVGSPLFSSSGKGTCVHANEHGFSWAVRTPLGLCIYA